MMKEESRRVLLLVACVPLVFFAVRGVRRPAASEGAQSLAVRGSCVQPHENQMNTPLQEAMQSTGATDIDAASELQQRQLETAREAQRTKQQEAASELQQRQLQATRPLAEES